MKKIIILLLVSAVSIAKITAQGCSDAGICNISKTYPSNSISKKNALEIGYIFGKGLDDIIYNNAFIGYNKSFKKNWSLNSKITYNQATGSFGTLGRLGDVFLVLNYEKKISNNSIIKPLFGIKAPLNASNFKINNISLPLDYQSSLGTFDALLGFDYGYKNWNFDAALQIPFYQLNKNSYFDEFSTSNVFPTTNLFKRKADALIRTSYKFGTNNKKWTFKPNIMAIYHLGNDTYENVFGKRQEINHSAGLTINASINTDYSINNNSSLKLSIAAPFLVREIRPDGLTRTFVASFTYQFKF